MKKNSCAKGTGVLFLEKSEVKISSKEELDNSIYCNRMNERPPYRRTNNRKLLPAFPGFVYLQSHTCAKSTDKRSKNKRY